MNTNHFQSTLEEMRRTADSLRSLSSELEASAEIRELARSLSGEDDRQTYRLPYATRPEFMGERWV